MSNVLLLTTPLVEGTPIEKYYGLITANQVAGTGYFTDLVASLSDVFGGNSGAYRESMNELYDNVTGRLREKAAKMGANAVVGISIDYDNISAKNMSMFMVSIQGTAVKLATKNEDAHIIAKNEISMETLYKEYNKKKILHKFKYEMPLDSDDWQFVQKNYVPELIEPLYEYYIKCMNTDGIIPGDDGSSSAYYETQKPEWAILDIQNYTQYLESLKYEDAIKYVYRDIKSFRHIIEKNKLFNASKILEIAKEGDLDTAISLLSVEKMSYNDVDLSEMKELCEYLHNLPEVGSKEEVKGGLFSSGGIKYICKCGCKNDGDVEFCTECGRNIKGITIYQESEIEMFSLLVETLSDLIK